MSYRQWSVLSTRAKVPRCLSYLIFNDLLIDNRCKQYQRVEEEMLLLDLETLEAESAPEDLFPCPNWWFIDEDGRDTTRMYGPYKRAQIGGLGYTKASRYTSS